MEKNHTSPSFLPLYDHEFPPISDEDFKRFHTIDRKLYGKLLNVLGREPAESMKVMAFFHWIEGVAKDRYFVANLFDFSSLLLNKVVDEALLCVKCTEEEQFSGYENPEIFLIPNILGRNFTLRYFHENRESAIRGITNSLKTVCFRAFDDIHVVKQPNYYTTRSGLVQSPNANVLNTDPELRRLHPSINNPSPYAPIGGDANLMIPSENKMEELGALDNSSRMMSFINPSHYHSGASNIEADLARAGSRMVPMNPSVGGSNLDELRRMATRMVPMNPSLVPNVGALNIEEYARATNRMVPMSPSRVPAGVGASNIDELARAATRMVPMNPSRVPIGVGASNIDELARVGTRMVPMNPNFVPGHVGPASIEEIARAAATRMVPMNPSHVPSMGPVGGEMLVRLPYGVPNQMVQYMPPYLPPPPPIPYNLSQYGSSSGSGVFIPQVLPSRPYNYHQDIGGVGNWTPSGGAHAMNMDNISELFKNNFNFLDDDTEVAPEDRTVFLTFSKGYPISEAEVKDFFTRKFGDDVEAVYMQEVAEDEQALYARLVTRTPALLEAIVDGGKAKYNINGKHVWARKYVKKQNPKIMFVGQSSSSVPST